MDQKILKKTVVDFLNAHRKMVIALVDEDGHPRTSLMLYAIDDNLNVYFGTRKVFGKYERLLRNPYVSISVIQEELDPLQVVDLAGKAEFVPEEKTEEVLTFFESKNPSKYYVKGADDFVMLKVTPSHIRWLDATSGDLAMHDIECE